MDDGPEEGSLAPTSRTRSIQAPQLRGSQTFCPKAAMSAAAARARPDTPHPTEKGYQPTGHRHQHHCTSPTNARPCGKSGEGLAEKLRQHQSAGTRWFYPQVQKIVGCP